ncbi:hypothetical protein, partial [Escherichia coli]|uniref:hypothetical protein n=1 Tax=Escherichia coli TaxID=562 RepID=UPI001BE413E5
LRGRRGRICIRNRARNVSLRRELILALSPILAARQDWVSNDELAEKITSLVDKIMDKADI